MSKSLVLFTIYWVAVNGWGGWADQWTCRMASTTQQLGPVEQHPVVMLSSVQTAVDCVKRGDETILVTAGIYQAKEGRDE
jgi:hypothetical protein